VTQQPGYPYPPMPVGPGSVPFPPPPVAGAPVHVEPVAGTAFGLAYAVLPPLTSGQAVGALVIGIGSVIVALVTICFGLLGAADGWGALVAGAFAILATILGVAAVSIGTYARRVIRRSSGAISGSGMATSGLVCGFVGVGLAVLGFAGALIATLAS
jgi:hypothetical protein